MLYPGKEIVVDRSQSCFPVHNFAQYQLLHSHGATQRELPTSKKSFLVDDRFIIQWPFNVALV
jgi:hypothetical protein